MEGWTESQPSVDSPLHNMSVVDLGGGGGGGGGDQNPPSPSALAFQ